MIILAIALWVMFIFNMLVFAVLSDTVNSTAAGTVVLFLIGCVVMTGEAWSILYMIEKGWILS